MPDNQETFIPLSTKQVMHFNALQQARAQIERDFTVSAGILLAGENVELVSNMQFKVATNPDRLIYFVADKTD